MRRTGIILVSAFLLSGATLPETGPRPVPKPVTGGDQPMPTPKPPQPQADDAKAKESGEPHKAQEQNGARAGGEQRPGWKDDILDARPVLAIEKEDPKEYAACLSELKSLGSTFAEVDRMDEGKGCGIDKPVKVTAILPGVTLKPEGVMRCEAALALARWTKETAAPAARSAFGAEARIVALNQASTYICRLRNNADTGKISEHARGNAVDIASFTLGDGKAVEIQPRDEDGTLTGAFQRAVTASACLYFTTVLDPGSDAAHEDHLHLDVIERRNGYRYCR
ncbi:extensin [Sinorhizobium medicae]|uniref:Extensin n=2 Tax=Sinorhizobium medicae TaxID=110321 RepID=A0A508WW33_9HYPH|nr:extensin family protein [Sinorhizobium medicae]ABR61129.1 Extensin family protein [Sinorhizobium medicae WSM419]MBO1943498.1 extensin family protein [Sinorhizobium medicae]MBO1959170.1 extensin family protein [Sinorhizobium medicae]MDX0405618.1 extensin [Sinorhizobium medicae]MDX0411138.1 extensin [Sinorhizobium medicae]